MSYFMISWYKQVNFVDVLYATIWDETILITSSCTQLVFLQKTMRTEAYSVKHLRWCFLRK